MEADEKQSLEDEMARREEGSAQVARGKKCWLELEGSENPRRAASSGVAGITVVEEGNQICTSRFADYTIFD
jgi:hypothetical protein